MAEIRWMNADGCDDLAAAEAMSITRSQIEWLRDESFASGLVVREPRRFVRSVVVAACVYSLTPRHILLHHFGTHLRFRRKGYGTVLMTRLQEKLDRNQRTALLVNVPDAWLGGQLFLRACGFRAVLPVVNDPCRGPCYQFRYLLDEDRR